MPVFTYVNTCIISFDVSWTFQPVLLLSRQLDLGNQWVWLDGMMSQLSHIMTLTFIIYALGAMTLATRGRRDRPYWAAPRSVAVSASGGRAMTRTRELNCSFEASEKDDKGKLFARPTCTRCLRYSLPAKPPTRSNASVRCSIRPIWSSIKCKTSIIGFQF